MTQNSGRRIRVLYLDHTALLSGGEIALRGLIEHLDKDQFEPVVVLFEDGPLVGEMRRMDVETRVVPLDATVLRAKKDELGLSSLAKIRAARASIAFVFTLRQLLLEGEFDIVHCNSLKSDVLGGLAARWAGVPVIWHVRDRIASDYLPDLVARGFRLLAGVIPNFIIANSSATMRALGFCDQLSSAVVYSGMNFRGGSNTLGVVHDGLAVTEFSVAQSVRHPVRLHPSPVVGLVGRIAPWKGQHVFIDAASAVLKSHPNIRFRIIGKVMFGEHDYEAAIRRQIQQLGIAQSVELVGFRSDIGQAMTELDLLVHASTTGEPFGQVIIEGMAAGLPVVATNGGGVPEIVEHGRTGLLVPMNDSTGMAQAILWILDNPLIAAKMGCDGRARVAELFTIQRTARQVEVIYSKVFRRYGVR